MLSIQSYLTLCGKSNCPFIFNHDFSVINPFICKAEFKYTGHTQTWLLPDLFNQEIA